MIELKLLSRLLLLCVTLSLLGLHAYAQSDTAKQPRVLLLLDGSASMVKKWNGDTKRFDQAEKFITKLMDSMYQVNPNVEFALRVFGHQYGVPEKNCYDTKKEVGFSKNNREQMKLRLLDIEPYGVSPIAFSLEEAANMDLVSLDKYYYSLVLITDGGESCGGNICEVVERLLNKKIFFRPYIVSLINYDPLLQQYECLGNLLIAADKKGSQTAIDTLVEAHTRIFQAVKSDPTILKPAALPTPKPLIPATEVPTETYNLAVLVGQSAYQLFIVDPPLPKNIKQRRWLMPLPSLPVIPEPPHAVQQLDALTVRKPAALSTNLFLQKTLKGKEWRISYPLVSSDDFPVETISASTIQSRRKIPEQQVSTNKPAILKKKNYTLQFPLVSAADFPEEKRIAGAQIGRMVARTKIYPIPTVYGTINPKSKRLMANFPLVKSVDFPEEAVAKVPQAPPPPEEKPMPFVDTLILPKAVMVSSVSPTKPSNNAKPTPPPKPRVEQIKDAPFLKETEESDKTTLFVYFSDGKGKYYKTEPQVTIMDAATGKEVKRFYRLVNRATGEPTPQNIPPGTYNLLVDGKANTYVRRLVVEEGRKTKLNIIVGRGSLKFEFLGNPKKPMTAYKAVVNRRFAPDPDVIQNAADLRNYEPGTYYAEVNTYPVHKAAFDIGFDEMVVISVPEPGQIIFKNTTAVGKVSLWMPLGDSYAQFGQVVVNGNPEEQRLSIQPGYYQARFKKNPNVPFEQDVIVKFKVESNRVTEIMLPK